MSVQAVSSSSLNDILVRINKLANKPSDKAVLTGCDSFEVSENKGSKFPLYTSTGEYADNPVARKTKEEIDAYFPQYAGMTDDEKWKAIVEKYTKDGLSYSKFDKMLLELANNQLLDVDIAFTAGRTAFEKITKEGMDYDIQNGIWGDDDISGFFTKSMNIDDFLLSLTQFEKDYIKCNEDSTEYKMQQELYSTIVKFSKE